MRMTGVLASIVLVVLLAPGARAAEPEVVYAVGDSITQGVGTQHEWQSWPARIGAQREGESGGCLIVSPCFKHESMTLQYHDKVLAQHPDVVILAYGINDLASGQASPEMLIAAMKRIEKRNAKRGIDTYVSTLTPTGELIFNMLGRERILLNRMIRTEFKGRVVHFSRLLTDPTNGLLAEAYDSGDGLHPNAAAYKLMARKAALTLRRDGHRVTLPRR